MFFQKNPTLAPQGFSNMTPRAMANGSQIDKRNRQFRGLEGGQELVNSQLAIPKNISSKRELNPKTQRQDSHHLEPNQPLA
jgi:hypothetical protein